MKTEQLQEQVNGMLHNQETEEYIREWLHKKHAVKGELADKLLVVGWRDYKATVRKTSLMRLVVSLIACSVLGAMLWFNVTYLGGRKNVGILMFTLLLPCLAYAGRQALQFMKGMEGMEGMEE